MTQPHYLDLDEVQSPVDFTLKFNGKTHKVEETSVGDFIKTAHQLEELSLNASVQKELEVTLEIIHRCLPTIPLQELHGLKLSQLQKIRDFVQTANGEKAEEVKPAEAAAAEGASGNAPKAN